MSDEGFLRRSFGGSLSRQFLVVPFGGFLLNRAFGGSFGSLGMENCTT